MRRLYTLRGDRFGRASAARRISIRPSDGNPLTRAVATIAAFWVKINNDWIFNLSGLLAYSFLFAIFPTAHPHSRHYRL